MFLAATIILYILGCVIAHQLYTLVEYDLEEAGMSFTRFGFAIHVVAWPVVALLSLFRKDSPPDGLD